MSSEGVNKCDLIEGIGLKNGDLAEGLVEEGVKMMMDEMIEGL